MEDTKKQDLKNAFKECMISFSKLILVIAQLLFLMVLLLLVIYGLFFIIQL